MTPERWEQIGKTYHAALKQPPAQRAFFLKELCGEDRELRHEVESLLTANHDAGEFLSTDAMEDAAKLLARHHRTSIIGKTLGDYKVLSLIGSGGMGEVYRARDRKLGREVAVKILPSIFVADTERLRRFEQEALTASALNHPNILTVYGTGEADSLRFIATEYVAGETLRQCFERARLRIKEALNISVQIASALVAAHKAGVVHRDIKPENIMIRRDDGIVKVLDFGLSKLEHDVSNSATKIFGETNKTAAGVVMGTVRYMSPEQARGKEVDARTDIFSLGVLMYEMLSERCPFSGETTNDVIAAILKTEPESLNALNPEIPTKLDRIVSKAMAKERQSRYQTVKDLLADLNQLQKQLEFEAEVEREFGVTRSSLKTDQAQRESGAVRISKPSVQNSIAVLPFANLSADPNNEYFCDGLAEDLLNALAKIDDLKVAARTSAFSFRGKNTNVSEIGQALNVNSVLEGSVRRSGNRLRITAQLVNVADGYQLWSERYDRQMKDVFDIQDEISLALVDALKVKLLGQTDSVLKRYTDNPQAHELCLKARFHMNKFTEAGFSRAIEYFEEAIAEAPDYALAYAGLAQCYTVGTFSNLPPTETFPKAAAVARQALTLDDRLSEVHTSLGIINMYYVWDWITAEREFRRAIELHGGGAPAHQWYGWFLGLRGRFEEAFAEFDRVRELNPLDVNLYIALGSCFYWSRDYERAIEQYSNALELDASSPMLRSFLVHAYLQAGKLKEAAIELEKSGDAVAPLNKVPLGYANAVLGRTNEALKAVEVLTEMAKERYFAPYHLAIVYAGLGETDLAFKWLEKALEERSSWMAWLNVEPKFERLRSDPRFSRLLQNIESNALSRVSSDSVEQKDSSHDFSRELPNL